MDKIAFLARLLISDRNTVFRFCLIGRSFSELLWVGPDSQKMMRTFTGRPGATLVQPTIWKACTDGKL